jgi:anti-anti-sigma regulatory factor
MDSSVVKALFETDALLRARGRRLAIHVNTASIVRRVLEISNISALMCCTASLEEAIRIASAVERES